MVGAAYEGVSPRGRWGSFGTKVWWERRREGITLDLLAGIAVTTSDLLREVEAGECDPGRRVAQDLDRALGANGALWDAWASAHLADLFGNKERPPTVADLLPEAYQVRAYAPLLLPDPYLTAEYAAALARVEHPMSSPLLDGPGDPRAGRLLPTSSGAPFHCLVVDEAALTRYLASADTRRAQLLHLHRLAQTDRVSVHLIPADTGPHPGLRGAFWTLCFSPAHTVVHIPHPCGSGHFIVEPIRVKAYADLFATLQGVALSPEDSLHRIADIATRIPVPGQRALPAG